jgi:hypothetical protein
MGSGRSLASPDGTKGASLWRISRKVRMRGENGNLSLSTMSCNSLIAGSSMSRAKDGVGLPRSDLGNASVHEDFASGDEATVVGGQEADHLCDIGGNSIPPDRGGAGGLGEKAGQLGLVQADQPVARGVRSRRD